ncbi:hypothetical protein KJY99_10360 [Cutibacterium avidum]|uniref:hypothetical protein n=1 Tax=Cutibacterium avidum TaxID=33010 RepID=UPI0020936859|nr:hypothetical protein [Cutibacterium avidum]MCO6678984.1 hypothetical protein [Cutibacterium avidum]
MYRETDWIDDSCEAAWVDAGACPSKAVRLIDVRGRIFSDAKWTRELALLNSCSAGEVSEEVVREMLSMSGDAFILADSDLSSPPPPIGRTFDLEELAKIASSMDTKCSDGPISTRVVLQLVRRRVSGTGQGNSPFCTAWAGGRLSVVAKDASGRDCARKTAIFREYPESAEALEDEFLQARDDAIAEFVRCNPLPKVASGRYDVVFSPQAAAVVIHEVVGHMLERDIWESISRQWPVHFPQWLSVSSAEAPSGWASSNLSWDDRGNALREETLCGGGSVIKLIGGEPGDHMDFRRMSGRWPTIPRMRSLRVSGSRSDIPDNFDPTLVIYEVNRAGLSYSTGNVFLEIWGAKDFDGPGEYRGGVMKMPISEFMARWVGMDSSSHDTFCMNCVKFDQIAPVAITCGAAYFVDAEVS